MDPTLFLVLTSLLKIVAIVFVVILPMVSYSVYAERRVSALIQDRLGPNRVGPAGLFQPIADAMKFILKEDFTPSSVNTFYYWLAPCLAMVPARLEMSKVPSRPSRTVRVNFSVTSGASRSCPRLAAPDG